jgi:CMP-N-acetylneuraminic acid synthetase
MVNRSKNKIVGIIFARKNSKRLKDKHLINIRGKPLIQYTFEYAKQTSILDDVICSTDSEEIGRLARMCGVDVIKRPADLARDESHLMEALEHALQQYHSKNKYWPEITVSLYGNVPYRKARIEDGVDFLYKKNADSVFTACRVGKYHPDWMFRDGGNGRIVYEHSSLQYRCQDLPAVYLATDAFIVSKTKVLLKRHPRTSLYSDFGERIFFIEEGMNDTVDIDDLNDLKYFDFLLACEDENG